MNMDLSDAPNINHLHAGFLVEELVRNGVRAFFLSPGSRNTPLSLAAAQHPDTDAVVHYDERGAAFAALGHALAGGAPAALVCTSGTAAAEWLPAVIEAAQSRVPLILLSADRPPELIDCGANQAIEQPGLFRPFTRHSVSLTLSDTGFPVKALLSTVDQAVYHALRPPAGPVHINCRFREPLAPEKQPIPDRETRLAPLQGWGNTRRRWTHWQMPEVRINEDAEKYLVTRIPQVKKGLIVAGGLRNGRAINALRRLIETLEWPVFGDITSGLRTANVPWLVNAHDLLLESRRFQAFCRPECVLQFGDTLTSKKLLAHLESLDAEQILIADHPFRRDPMHREAMRLECGIETFASWLTPAAAAHETGGWGRDLNAFSGRVQYAIDAWLESRSDLNGITAVRSLTRLRPADALLFSGNSMPVRALDRYAAPDGPPGLVLANRGASGIDGNVAAIAGCARAHAGPAAGIIGDMALLHDLNSLALLRDLEKPVALVVINNNGGGIFSMLPIAAWPEHFEALFTTPHGMDFSAAAQQFGLAYRAPDSAAAYEEALKEVFAGTRPVLIEARVDREENLRAHRELAEHIRVFTEEHFSTP
jgi:2-succinyl-5-enolpyruvyl-6-hydroxy-3-cyclohexene-1-carboxylate synthase